MLARYVVRKKRFRYDDDETPNAKGSLFISDPSVRTPPRPMGLQALYKCIILYNSSLQSRKKNLSLRSSKSHSIQSHPFQILQFSNASPTLFKAAQWNIKQS